MEQQIVQREFSPTQKNKFKKVNRKLKKNMLKFKPSPHQFIKKEKKIFFFFFLKPLNDMLYFTVWLIWGYLLQ